MERHGRPEMLLVLLVLAAGPGFAEMKEVKDPNGVYTIAVPQDWQVQVGRGADREALPGMVVAAKPDAQVSVMIKVEPKQAESLDGFVNGLVEALKQQPIEWKELFRGRKTISGRPAVLIRSASKLAGKEQIRDSFCLLTDRHQVQVIMSCDQKDFERVSGTFVAIFKSLRLAGGEEPPHTVPAADTPQPPAVETPGATKLVQGAGGACSIAVPGDWQVQKLPGLVVAAKPGSQSSAAIKVAPRQSQTVEQFVQGVVAECGQRGIGWLEVARKATTVSGVQGIFILSTSKPQDDKLFAENYFAVADRHQIQLILTCRVADLAEAPDIFTAIRQSWQLGGGQGNSVTPLPPPIVEPPIKPPKPVLGKQVRDGAGAFSFSVPADWQVNQQLGSAVAVSPDQRVNVTVVAAPRQAATLGQFVQNMVAMTRMRVPNWVPSASQAIRVSNLLATRIRATGTPGGQNMVADYLFVLAAQRQITVVVSCQQQEFGQHQALFDQIIGSFKVP